MVYGGIVSDFSGVEQMTMIKNDLLAARKELRETSLIMTSGQLPSTTEVVRYFKTHDWAIRMIHRTETQNAISSRIIVKRLTT